MCSIQERSMGKSLGTAERRRGLWYMDRSKTDREGMHMLAAVAEDKETRALIHHCRASNRQGLTEMYKDWTCVF